jgi:carbon monoxide dehydrogenase subunit G
MLIENSFEVEADPDRVFDFLQNAYNIAACFPGAELTEDLGNDSYRGKVKIKLGPVADVSRRMVGDLAARVQERIEAEPAPEAPAASGGSSAGPGEEETAAAPTTTTGAAATAKLAPAPPATEAPGAIKASAPPERDAGGYVPALVRQVASRPRCGLPLGTGEHVLPSSPCSCRYPRVRVDIPVFVSIGCTARLPPVGQRRAVAPGRAPLIRTPLRGGG